MELDKLDQGTQFTGHRNDSVQQTSVYQNQSPLECSLSHI